MTSTTKPDVASVIEQVVVGGDLSKLSPSERVTYYDQVCRSLGLNPLTRPFQYLMLNGRMTLYASRDCTDQLRRIHNVHVRISSRERVDDVYVVTALATLPDGRTDESVGAVAIANLKGDALANALMKAETKAKRRATLSIVGLGWLDETEIDTIPDARVVAPDMPIEQAAKAAALPPKRTPIICTDCNRPIVSVHMRNGRDYSVKEIAERSQTEYGRILCWACSRLAAEARRQEAAATAPQTPETNDDEYNPIPA